MRALLSLSLVQIIREDGRVMRDPVGSIVARLVLHTLESFAVLGLTALGVAYRSLEPGACLLRCVALELTRLLRRLT